MLYTWQDLAFCGSIALPFIGDDDAWRVLEPFEELTEEAFCRVCVPSALHLDIQHIAILINRPPQVVDLPIDAGERPHPDAICLPTCYDVFSTHEQTFARISDTIAEPFHR